MSYIFRINVKWLKYALDLKTQNSALYCSSCSAAASKSLLNYRPGFISRIPRRFLSTSLQPVVQPSSLPNKRPIKFKKSTQNVTPATETVALATVSNPAVVVHPAKSNDNSNKPKVAATNAPKSQDNRSIKKDIREKLAKVKRDDLDFKGKESSLNKTLLSYVELCVFTDEMHRAVKTLNYYRAKKNFVSHYPSVTDVNIYNTILHGYAASGNLSKVKEIFQILDEEKLKPNPQSYAAILECLGRVLHTANSLKNIRITIRSLHANGYTLNDIFNRCTFVRDQREVILDAIRKFKPTFKPEIIQPNQEYICPLLEHLNTKSNSTFVSPSKDVIAYEDLVALAKKQLQFELTGKITIKSIENKDCDDNYAYFRKVLKGTEEAWATTIRTSLDRNLNSLASTSQRHSRPWTFCLYPFLKVLKPEDYVEILLMEIRKLAEGSETYSPSVPVLHRQLGQAIMERFFILRKKEAGILDKIDELYREYLKWYLEPELQPSAVNTRQQWQHLLYDPDATGPHVDVNDKPWTSIVVASIGRFFYGIIMRDIKIDVHVTKVNSKHSQFVPAFYTIFRKHGTYVKEEVKPHPALVKLFQAASRDELTFDTTQVPMVCPPLPWSSIRSGGYLLSSAKIIRLPFQAQQQMDRLENSPPENLYPALDSLNQLSSIPWKINEEVLDVIIEVFNSKGNDAIGIAPPPSECPLSPVIDSNMTKEESIAAHKQRNILKRQKAEMYSLWCDALYRFSLANHFRKDILWFPHNLDFRGRVYPCPPHLNHLGADAARSILVFAKGEPLGPNGLDWIKIHMINLTGLKKRESLSERLKYANEIMDEIFDSAENPLTGRKWWMQSDEPWQTLAACMEIVKVIKSGDPESYISNFPIHQDGSCNGLQHYAALGRDQAGAESVNLAPSVTPQDVYSDVAALVEKQRAIDAAMGLEIAKVLDGFIKRKVIKQTIMTTVYGVTRYGAKLQIAKQLKDINEFPQEHVWNASFYLVQKTFDSLQEMFTSTKEIQDWFTESARLIAQICGQNVEWVTPLGLPVVQPYSKVYKAIVDPRNPHRIPEHGSYDAYERPNVMKQRNAFPPNYIHSLDSSHMMLTSLHCERQGISFISVHDCYWTHPLHVDIMSKICREQFVALHSQPILEDLSAFLTETYSYGDCVGDESLLDSSKTKLNRILLQVPPKGTFNLNDVLKSVYFFS